MFGSAVVAGNGVVYVGAPAKLFTVSDDDCEDPLEQDLTGAVYAFSAGTSGWSQTAWLAEFCTFIAPQSFGAAIDCDWPYLVIGAPATNGSGGYVAIYSVDASGDHHFVQRIITDQFDAGLQMGTDVAIAGDVIAVGVPYPDDLGLDDNDAGRVDVYRRSTFSGLSRGVAPSTVA